MTQSVEVRIEKLKMKNATDAKKFLSVVLFLARTVTLNRIASAFFLKRR